MTKGNYKVAEGSQARSNAYLSDEDLAKRSGGSEPNTSVIDQVSAGYALENRKKSAKEKVDIFAKDHGSRIEAIRNKVLAKRNK